MSEIKLLNQQNVKQVLLTDWEGYAAPKQVSKEALAWVNQVVLSVCRNLVVSGRRSPSGRLMAPTTMPAMAAVSVGKEPYSIEELQAGANKPHWPTNIAFAGMRPLPERLDARAKEVLAANGGERPEAEKDPESYYQWKVAVANGGTRLGYEEWKAQSAAG